MENKKIKVMGFDGWTMGSRHYVRLLKAFDDVNIDLVLVHLGSWSDDTCRPKEEYIDGLLVRDISWYRKQDFKYILEAEKPDVVLFLSTETFLHRAFLRYCKQIGVPSIHLFHGLMGVIPAGDTNEAYKVNPIAQINYAFARSVKFFKKTFLVYSLALLRTNALANDWRRFFTDLYQRGLGRDIAVPAIDSRADRCCVYTKVDLEVARIKWDYSDDEAVAVGNPDLTHFGFDESSLGNQIGISKINDKSVVYIDSGISSHGLNFKSDDDYLDFLIQCYRHLRDSGFSLSVKVKPHPVSRFSFFRSKLKANGIEVLDNDNFQRSLLHASACIIEPSTLSLIPCLLGMTVYRCRVGPLASLSYGEVFETYPRAKDLNSWDQLTTLLTSQRVTLQDGDATWNWIQENAGPLPASDMPRRVADVVLDLVRKS